MAPVAAPSAAAPGYKDEDPHGYGTPYGIYSRIHYSDFPGLQSLRSESSNLISDKHPTACQANSEVLYKDAGASVFNHQQNSVVSTLLDHSGAEGTGPYPPRQDLNQYPFDSSYDKYMTQLSSCSTNTQSHIFPERYADSSEMTKTTGPVMNDTTGENSFSSYSYMNPCRINLDHFDCVWNEQKYIGYQTTDKQYGKWSNSLDDTTTAGNYPLNPLRENCLGVDCLENGKHMQESSETKHDMGNCVSKCLSPEIGFLQPREFSSELLDVNNTSVDSPCWKGTPATYPSPFGVTKNKDAPHAAIGTVGCSSYYQSQKAPDLNFVFPARFAEHQEVSSSEDDFSKVFKLPARFQNFNNFGVPPVRVYADVDSHATYSPINQRARTSSDHVEDFKNVITSSQHKSSRAASKGKLLDEHSGDHTGNMADTINGKVSNPIITTAKLHVDNLTNPHGNSSSTAVRKEESTQKRGEYRSQCYAGAEGITPNMSSDSSSSTRAIFLKLLHNLSVALLSICKDGSVFPDDEEEILQSVIQNLTAASSKRSKIEPKTDDGMINSSQIKFGNSNCMDNSFSVAMHERQSTSESVLEFKTAVSQVLAAVPEDKIIGDTKVSEGSIYKKLWIETEASACKLKYELQLARMKLARMKGHNNTLNVSYLSEGSKGSNSSITSNKPDDLVKESSAPLHHQGEDSNSQSPIVNRSVVNGGDDDVFARLKVLQSRTDNATSFGKLYCEGQQEVNKKPCEMEDAVMARLKVLNSRPDNVTSLSQESMPDARINRADDAVMARLTISESLPSNVTFLGQKNSKQQADAGTKREDVVDDAIMARLRFLKSRPDNVTSMCHVSKEHEDACNEQLNMDEVEVMSSRHLINMEQPAKFMQSINLANRLERNDLRSGPEFVDGTCARENRNVNGSVDVASPKSCDAPSEEMNKDAVQGEDNLGGNHVWPEAAGDSVCAEGSQEVHLISFPVHQYGNSPSDWEHVLKEDFFHAGN